MDRWLAKIEAGARFFQTQAVMDVEAFAAHVAELRANDPAASEGGVKIIAGVLLLKSARVIDFINNKLAGLMVPDEIAERIRSARRSAGCCCRARNRADARAARRRRRRAHHAAGGRPDRGANPRGRGARWVAGAPEGRMEGSGPPPESMANERAPGRAGALIDCALGSEAQSLVDAVIAGATGIVADGVCAVEQKQQVVCQSHAVSGQLPLRNQNAGRHAAHVDCPARLALATHSRRCDGDRRRPDLPQPYR